MNSTSYSRGVPAWLLRGLVLAAVHAAVSVTLAKITVFRPTETTAATSVAFAVLIGTAAAWGAIDGWYRRANRGRNWMVAAVIAGPVAGLLDVAGRALLVDQTGASALADALTVGAAFIILLVFLPAGLGLFVGSKLEPPQHKKPLDHHAGNDSEPEDAPEVGSRAGDQSNPGPSG